MASVPSRVAERLSTGLRRFQPIIESARSRDVNEHDTVVIIIDILAEVFGFDKYAEITREYAIRGTYCDLAIKLDGKLAFLVEVKAIGLELKDSHVKQAIDYAANQGVEWVALTNGVIWRVFRVSFGKPIDKELVVDFDISLLSPRANDDICSLYLLTRESMVKSALQQYHDQRQATNRFFIAAAILREPVLELIRRELRRVSPDVKIDIDEIRETLEQDVLKRDVIEGTEADSAKRRVARAAATQLRIKKTSDKKVEVERVPSRMANGPEVRKP